MTNLENENKKVNNDIIEGTKQFLDQQRQQIKLPIMLMNINSQTKRF